WHFLAVQKFLDRCIRRRTDRAVEEQDLVAFDKAARHLHGLRRAVAVVERDQLDLATVDAARLAHGLEVGSAGRAHRAGGRNRPAGSRRRRVLVIIWSDGARCSNAWSVTGPMLSVTAWSCRWMLSIPL